MVELEFPLLVASGTRVPPKGPPLYKGNNNTGNLDFFREEATNEEWERYRGWIQEQEERRQNPDEHVATVSGEHITS